MRKAVLLMCMAAAVLSCIPENLAPVEEAAEPAGVSVTFNISVAGTKAAKTDWAEDDVIYVFFKGLETKYLKMVRTSSGDWTEEAGAGAFAGTDFSGLSDKTLTAVHFPVAVDVNYAGGTFSFTKDGVPVYNYYLFDAARSYTCTVDAGNLTVTATLSLGKPADLAQFHVAGIQGDVAAYTFGCSLVRPVACASVGVDGTLTEDVLQAGARLSGFADSDGAIFAGRLESPGVAANYAFTLASDDGIFTLTRSQRTLEAGKMYNFPALTDAGWSVTRCLTFRSEGSGETRIRLSGFGAPALYYSFDRSSWESWDKSELSFSADRPLYLYGENPEGFSAVGKFRRFATSGANFSVKGSIMSLLCKDGEMDAIPNEYCFYGLFQNCTNLVAAPELPARTLTGHCYHYMFAYCTNLSTAPELPALTLAEDCYYCMFYGCTNLSTAPELPARTLAANCYTSMFGRCTSLETAPELPAQTLAAYCYRDMFANCTNLSTAPELPALTLAEYCYYCMFYGCTNLSTAPELPARTLAANCYAVMFGGCTSLETAPELPAQTLVGGCYRDMFKNCTKLNKVTCFAMDISANSCTSGWLKGVASSGEFTGKLPESAWSTGPDGIPSGWTYTKRPSHYLTFRSEGSGETRILLARKGNPDNAPVLYYSFDENNWESWDYSELSFSADRPLYLCGDNQGGFSVAPGMYSRFETSGAEFRVEGSVMSLLNKNVVADAIPNEYCFYGLFENCTNLVAAPELPARTLATGCYSNMFANCTNLSTAPELPALTLKESCYAKMFYGCTSLVAAPELPAPKTNHRCYEAMFSQCRSLNKVICLATSLLGTQPTKYWLTGVAGSGEFYGKLDRSAWGNAAFGVPDGWTYTKL